MSAKLELSLFRCEPIACSALEQLEAGKLKFALQGRKLKGEFNLIKLGRREKQWLLIKARDEFAEDEIEKLFKKTDADGRLYTTIPLHAPGETKRGKTGRVWRGIEPPSGRHWRTEPDKLEKLDEKGLIEWSKRGVPRRKIYAPKIILRGSHLPFSTASELNSRTNP